MSNKDIGKSETPLDNLQMRVGKMIKIKDGIEENFLRNSVKTISRGGDFGDGKRSK